MDHERTGVASEQGPRTTDEGGDDRTREIQGALVWEADAWAVHVELLSEASVPMLGPGAERHPDEGFIKRHVHPDDRGALMDAMFGAAANAGVHTCAHRIVRTDGTIFWAQSTIHRSTGSDGAAVLMGVTVDVTRLVDEREALRAAEAQARLLVQSLRGHGVCLVTAQGEIATWSSGAEQLTGYAGQEVIGSPLARLFPDDELARDTPGRLLRTALTERSADHEGWLLRKDGARYWAAVALSAAIDEQGQLRGVALIARDLTERRQIEQTLQQREAHFRLLVESVQDYAVFTVSLEGLVEDWNRGAQLVKGYRAHEIIGLPMARFFPPDEVRRQVPEGLLEEAELRGHATYEGWLVRKGGARFWGLLTLSAVEDEHGRLRGFANVARDLSERKRAEDELRAREEQLRLLIDSLQDCGVFMVSPGGLVTSWSPGAARLEGYAEAEIVGAPAARFFPADEVAQGTPARLFERALAEGRADYEGWIVPKVGGMIWASLFVSAVKDREGNLHGCSYVLRDLTDRMRAERAQVFLADVGTVLASSLDRFATYDAVCRLAIRELAEWCILFALDAGVVEPVAVAHVSPEREALLRVAVGPVPFEPRTGRGVCNVLQTGQAELEPDVSEPAWLAGAIGITDPDLLRELRVRSYLCVPLTARSKTFGALFFVAPPSARYSTHELHVAQELARRAALAIDNARLFEAAQVAVRTRQEVLAVVTHDLRSPLSAIQMGAVQLTSHPPDDPALTVRVASRIKRASDRMTHMIHDLLDFSSIETGRLRLEMESHDAAGLVTEALESLTPVAAEKHVTLERKELAAGVPIRCDRERIIQVFSNLIGNAVKFTASGGRVTVSSRVERERVVFSVRDMGPGIAGDDLIHVFDRYWQAERRAPESLGLGLAISRGIIESHGGTIWVESTLGQGATFSFSLPIER